MRLEELDKNFAARMISEEGLDWYDRYEEKFEFDGCADLKSFWRIDAARRAELPEGIFDGYPSTGIRLRFKTDAARVVIKSKLYFPNDMAHMARFGSNGFDVFCRACYEDGSVGPYIFANAMGPGAHFDELSGEAGLPDTMDLTPIHEVLINFPLYNGVKELVIGLPAGSRLEKPAAFGIPTPIVFYGSSITQGACATRPANAYTHMLAMTLDASMTNLGFSGRAKGERVMARYIASLPMSAFVMDYDHNADTVEDLSRTHEPFFKIIRAAQPTLPIILVSRPNTDKSPEDADARFEVIERTYRNAKAAGDQNVYLVDGRKFFGEGAFERGLCTVDTCHPTDIGFYRMYKTILPVLREALANR